MAVTLALAYPDAKTIHLVMDNLNIHRRKSLVDVFGTKMAGEVWDRFTVLYTPTHGSWLNQAKIEIGLFPSALGKIDPVALGLSRASHIMRRNSRPSRSTIGGIHYLARS